MVTVRACIRGLLASCVGRVETRIRGSSSRQPATRRAAGAGGLPLREAPPPTPKAAQARYIMCASSLSWNRSAESSTTVFLPVFFHQCDVPLTSAVDSPVLWRIGDLQVLRYSVIVPLTM